MSDMLAYSQIVPLGAFCVAIAYAVCHAWIKTSQQDVDLQLRTMEHQERMKAMELDISRNNAAASAQKNLLT
ncbi:hypothetical protein [Undibacterium sp. TS12]|uniref:hypothetical protein n=1 Tax=Undibacterium sp. TS12 TaxID=2908202 RepID=UPI001F4C8AD5|nr:hypothetical protein [Undibacterium sp. TS12]MCH8621073.1 hypothetical protein [Undibacterium sp. TS12]